MAMALVLTCCTYLILRYARRLNIKFFKVKYGSEGVVKRHND